VFRIGSLIVAAAQFAYQIYSEHKKNGEKASKESLARTIRVEWRKETDLTTGAEKVIEIVTAEIVERSDEEGDQ
jgi:hypothetical protein